MSPQIQVLSGPSTNGRCMNPDTVAENRLQTLADISGVIHLPMRPASNQSPACPVGDVDRPGSPATSGLRDQQKNPCRKYRTVDVYQQVGERWSEQSGKVVSGRKCRERPQSEVEQDVLRDRKMLLSRGKASRQRVGQSAATASLRVGGSPGFVGLHKRPPSRRWTENADGDRDQQPTCRNVNEHAYVTVMIQQECHEQGSKNVCQPTHTVGKPCP